LLWPNRFDQKAISNLRTSLGEYAAAGQLQQRPAPKGGGIIKAKWWREWERDSNPQFIYVIQSWDTAFSQRDGASYSACTTWGVFSYGTRYNIMLMSRWRDRCAYPDLRRAARELYDDFSPDAVLIEKESQRPEFDTGYASDGHTHHTVFPRP
jgi:phage terminase large subunit-like protein